MRTKKRNLVRYAIDIHETPFEKVQKKYFYTICKCTVVFKLKIFNL